MSALFQVVGAVAVLALLSIVIALSCATINWYMERWRERQKHIATREIGNQILNFSWWCKEPTSQAALVAVGQQILRYGGLGDYEGLRTKLESLSSSPERMVGAR